ncbi:hypothetical protein [Litoreibacter arenae]|uniref:Uncharacterized protein n=1 Tax=Litoreibacter arenae DSM 19593 TaxID=1123360 RepID=S9RP79_9RHOB|nr:hypothetical protein [Litoreibacter arenae]EPX79900.1 hypothetical protein thalar_01236 [Litoreibacter arenae DSM 19593]
MFDFLKIGAKALGLGATQDELRELAQLSLDPGVLDRADAIGNQEELTRQVSMLPARIGASFGAQLAAR